MSDRIAGRRLVPLALAACLSLLGGSVAAQAGPPPDPLGPPRSPLMCRALSSDSLAPGAGYGLKYIDGIELRDDRDIQVGYDSAGRPLTLTLIATMPPVDRTVSVLSYVVRFGGDSSATGVRMRWTATADTAAVRRLMPSEVGSRVEQLDATELQRARRLAEHLWSIRCGRQRAR